jgi:transcriptional regulator with XRE-family HTH domain
MILKDLFISKGVKQKWLAQKLGVSEVTVSQWAQEKSYPSKKHLDKICEVLNVSIKELSK